MIVGWSWLAKVDQKIQDTCQEERKSVQWQAHGVVCKAVQPDLGVFQSDGDIGPTETLMRSGVVVESKALFKDILLILGQESARFGIVGDEEVCSAADEHSCDSFENEDPLPAIESSNALHVCNGPCENTAERTGEGGSGEEEGDAELSFGSEVEESKIEDDAGEEASFCDAEEETDDEEAGEVVDHALKGCDNTPNDGDGW